MLKPHNFSPLRVQIWMNMPSHHQSQFFREIINQGVDLKVCYYGRVDTRRKSMGWDGDDPLSSYELYFSPDYDSLEMISDWRERIHIVPGYGSHFLCKLARKLSNAKVSWAHWSERSHSGLRWYLTYPVKSWYARLVNKHAIGALGCGNLALEDFVRWGMKIEKLGLLPYSPHISKVNGSNPSESLSGIGENVFLYVGSLESRKGIDVLLKAFAALHRQHTDFKWVLVLVGKDFSNGAYAASAKKMDIGNSVVFQGVIPAIEIATCYLNASVVILPSRFDGWGAVINEGAAHGKALIVSDQCGAAQHLVDPGVNGFVVKAGDRRSLANAMRAYMLNPDLAARHGKASSLIYERYSPQHNARRFVEILDSWMVACNNESMK
ncbi:MAG: glycosyltransferase family 4 protein [Methylotenera sp.]